MNGETRQPEDRRHSSILYTYEDILYRKGIFVSPITKEAFKVLYDRYKRLGGTMLFHYHLK